jgi:hypothetical protein
MTRDRASEINSPIDSIRLMILSAKAEDLSDRLFLDTKTRDDSQSTSCSC